MATGSSQTNLPNRLVYSAGLETRGWAAIGWPGKVRIRWRPSKARTSIRSTHH